MSTILALVLIPLIIFYTYRSLIYKNELDGYDSWEKNESLPLELRQAKIYMSEKELKGLVGTTKVFGQVDQVFLTPRQSLVVSDTKTRKRHRVYDSDVNQISLYAFLLNNEGTPYPVEPYGYVRTVVSSDNGTQSVRYHKIQLKYRASELFAGFA